MNKKFWMLIVTGAVLAAGVTASGCAAQRRINPTLAPTATAIETTSETEAQPEETEMAPAEEKTFTNDNTSAAKTLENKAETEDGEGVTADPVKTIKKTAKKTTTKKTVKTTKKSSKKSAADKQRALIVKTARENAMKFAANYQNMGEKIAAAKQAAAKKNAAQKNAEARKDMNKAAQDAQNAAKEEQGKKYVKRVTQKADAKIGAQKAAEAEKKAIEAKKASEKKAAEAKAAAKKDAERRAAAKKAAEREAARIAAANKEAKKTAKQAKKDAARKAEQERRAKQKADAKAKIAAKHLIQKKNKSGKNKSTQNKFVKAVIAVREFGSRHVYRH